MTETIIAVGRDLLSFFWPQNSFIKHLRLGVLVIVIIGSILFLKSSGGDTTAPVNTIPLVTTSTVADVLNTNEASFIGTVRAVNEAQIKTETAGLVTSITVSAGDVISAGTVVATLENASERASVLQAEGVYEAAVATAAQSDVSVVGAENSLQTARNNSVTGIGDALTLAEDTVYNSFDTFFTDPTQITPGFRLSNTNYASQMNSSRLDLTATLQDWTQLVASLDTSDDLQTSLSYSEQKLTEIAGIVNTFIEIFNNQDTTGYTTSQLGGFSEDYLTLKSTLAAEIDSLKEMKVSLKNAEDTLVRIKLGGTQGTISTANAQVKQALGSLRSAQANLAKTILRSPIPGTVNSVEINTGDFVQAYTQVAEVANNSALEIAVHLGDADLTQISIGDIVMIENSVEGTVTNIAPALDSQTLKTEVKIATESTELTNGDTVTVSFAREAVTRKENAPLLVPITAVKFTVTDGAMFGVVDGVLVELPIVVGPIVGSYVTIESGIDLTTVFVTDVRGLSSGQKVEPINN